MSVILSFCSGILGVVVTLIFSAVMKWYVKKNELRLLKSALFVNYVETIKDIEDCRRGYENPYKSTEYRVDESLLLFAREKLITRLEDKNLLCLVSRALRAVCELNRLMELYRDECFYVSSNCSDAGSDYIERLRCVVLNSFKSVVKALTVLCEYSASENESQKSHKRSDNK